MTTAEFDKKFDNNDEEVRRPNLELKRINIDFPTWDGTIIG